MIGKYLPLPSRHLPQFFNLLIIELMEYFPLAVACGSIIFSLILYPEASKTPYIISLIFSGANFIFPSEKLNKILCKVDDP